MKYVEYYYSKWAFAYVLILLRLILWILEIVKPTGMSFLIITVGLSFVLIKTTNILYRKQRLYDFKLIEEES